jgi:class 3 adenylate cyclase
VTPSAGSAARRSAPGPLRRAGAVRRRSSPARRPSPSGASCRSCSPTSSASPRSQERDAEDVRDTLTRYFEIATDVIGRYGGTVEKFIGDAVMAVWGAPAAREDDAERAVRAALDLVDAVRSLGPTISARAGVLTGEAAVTLGATNQGMVAGDLVNTASRLQSVAAPGTVLVGEATQRPPPGRSPSSRPASRPSRARQPPSRPGEPCGSWRSAAARVARTSRSRPSWAGTRSSGS